MKHKERCAFLCYHRDLEVATSCLDETQLGQLLLALYRFSLGQTEDEETLSPMLRPVYMFMRNRIAEDAKKYDDTCEKRRQAASSRYGKEPGVQDETDASDEEATEEEAAARMQTTANACNGIHEQPNKKENKEENKREKKIESKKEREMERERGGEKEKEMGKAGEKTGGKKAGKNADASLTAPTPALVAEYAHSLGKEMDGQRFCDYYAARGWQLRDTPIRDWQALVRMWLQEDEKNKRGASPPGKPPRQVRAQQYTQRQYTAEELDFASADLFREAGG
ncbi:MAG: hypothetical protein IIX10_03820 [Clostridia bacterium]|nr:hypothetical protein [Clostridia bacterium]